MQEECGTPQVAANTCVARVISGVDQRSSPDRIDCTAIDLTAVVCDGASANHLQARQREPFRPQTDRAFEAKISHQI